MADLRDHLFETLEALRDEEKPMDLERANAVCKVATVLISTARVEIDLVKTIGGMPRSDFIAIEPESRKLPTIKKLSE